MSDRNVNGFVDFSDKGEFVEDVELLVHFRYHVWAYLHQLPE